MQDANLQKAINQLISALKIVPRTLLGSIYGDMLFPYHRPIWLGSIVGLAEPFDIPEFLSRTTALRMAKMGLFDVIRIGRLSYYSASEGYFRGAIDLFNRVYNPPEDQWSGGWLLMLTGSSDLSNKDYAALRRALLWRGVGQIAPHVFMSPNTQIGALTQLVRENGLTGKVQLLEAVPREPASLALMKTIVANAWDIDGVERGYEKLLANFRPIWTHLDRLTDVDPRQAYMVRTLLINEHRRLVLRDPRLPKAFLPIVWAGNLAFSLTSNIYQKALSPSEAYLRSIVRTPDGPLPATPGEILNRFGGLTLSPAA